MRSSITVLAIALVTFGFTLWDGGVASAAQATDTRAALQSTPITDTVVSPDGSIPHMLVKKGWRRGWHGGIGYRSWHRYPKWSFYGGYPYYYYWGYPYSWGYPYGKYSYRYYKKPLYWHWY